MSFLDCITEKKSYLFISGIVAGLVLPSIARSNTVHKAAVNLTAKGMNLKDEAVTAYESVKEDAQDIYAEAKKKAADGDGPAD